MSQYTVHLSHELDNDAELLKKNSSVVLKFVGIPTCETEFSAGNDQTDKHILFCPK